MLSGGLLGLNFDTLVSVDGSIASAPGLRTGTGFKHNPPAHAAVGPTGVDEHTDPLSVTALQGINVNVTGTSVALSSILDFIVKPDVGALNQYSYASAPDSESRGAAGFVDDHGVVRTKTGPAYPDFSTINLKDLVASVLGSQTAGALSGITDLQLQIGAIAGRARLVQACNAVSDPTGRRLTRDYLLAHLRLLLTSPLLATVVTTITNTLTGILSNPLISTTLNVLVTAIGVLRGWVQTEVRVNPAAITGNVPSGPEQPIQLNLGTGVATIDIGALLGSEAFGRSDDDAFLNNVPPNTILFADPGYQLPTTAVNDVAQGVIDSTAAILKTSLEVRGRTALGSFGPWQPVAAITGGAIPTLLDAVIDVAKGIITTVLNPVLAPVRLLLNRVFDDILEQTIRITVNEQNNPGANNAPATPGFIHQASTRMSGVEAGRFDVAPIALHAVDGLANAGLVDLYLARGSVGPHTAV